MPKIAISITSTKYLSKQESKANAKLIAAAPEMLELIIKCKDTVLRKDVALEIDELLNKILE